MVNPKIAGLFLFMTITLGPVFSQTVEDIDWKEGALLTKELDSIVGKIHLDWETNEVLISNPEKFRALTPHQVLSFFFYDDDLELFRYFATYRGQDYQPKIFEQLLVGNYHFIRKLETVEFELYEPNFYDPSGDYPWISRPMNDRKANYYIWIDEQLIRVQNFKRQILRLTLNAQELKEFVDQNELSYKKRRDQARIIQFLNDLEEPDGISIR